MLIGNRQFHQKWNRDSPLEPSSRKRGLMKVPSKMLQAEAPRWLGPKSWHRD